MISQGLHLLSTYPRFYSSPPPVSCLASCIIYRADHSNPTLVCKGLSRSPVSLQSRMHSMTIMLEQNVSMHSMFLLLPYLRGLKSWLPASARKSPVLRFLYFRQRVFQQARAQSPQAPHNVCPPLLPETAGTHEFLKLTLQTPKRSDVRQNGISGIRRRILWSAPMNSQNPAPHPTTLPHLLAGKEAASIMKP